MHSDTGMNAFTVAYSALENKDGAYWKYLYGIRFRIATRMEHVASTVPSSELAVVMKHENMGVS